MNAKDEAKIIDNVIELLDSQTQTLALLLIANMQQSVSKEDAGAVDIVSSYNSDAELDEFINGVKEVVSYVDVSYGEKDFISKLHSGGFDSLNSFKKIAYTDTASGNARSKSALIPSLCELYGIPYCSNDIFTSALLDNKMATYGLLKSFDVPLPRTWFYSHTVGWIGEKAKEDILLIAKPAYGCASIGITQESVSTLSKQFLDHIEKLSRALHQPILVQEFIKGYEVEVPVFDLEEPFAPGCIGLSMNDQKNMDAAFFTYDTIFEDGFELFNFDLIDSHLASTVKDISQKAYRYLQLKGPVRFDYRINETTGGIYLMDFNNSPHLGTKHSFSQSIIELGYSYEDMLKLVLYPAAFSR